MKADEVLKLLAKLDQRLSIIWDQARATREQAQNTVDRIDRLRLDIQRLDMAGPWSATRRATASRSWSLRRRPA